MEYSLRPYNDSDYNFIYQTKKNAYKEYVIANYGEWNEDIQRQYFSDFIDKSKQNIKIITIKDKAIGFYQDKNLKNGDYEIVNICIIPEYQGKGIGTQILKDKITEHADQNIKIQYFKQNPVGKLYERLGFKPNGETKTHFQMTMADHIDTINNTISVKQRFRKGQRS